MRYGLGIDIGTAFTAAAVSRDGRLRKSQLGASHPLMPSVVGLLPDGTLYAGDPGPHERPVAQVQAHEFRRGLGDSAPVLLGSRSCTPGELLARVLTTALERVTAFEGGPPDRVVVTFPAAWGPYRREQFAEVTRQAGVPRDKVTLLSEAEAVAIHYLSARPPDGPAPIAVYDVGGSTFDATVVQPFPSGPAGVLGIPETLEWFGGVEIDEAVLRHLDHSTRGVLSRLDPRQPDEAIALARLRAACVRAKEALSARPEVTIDAGRDGPVTLTRAELEEWLRPYLSAGLPALHRVLADTEELGAVLLVGGTSHVPLVRRMLAVDLGRSVVVPPEVQYGAALGAALVAGRQAQRLSA